MSILINSYALVEQQVYNGSARAVSKLLEDVQNFSKPDVVVETIAASVMEELMAVLDFGQSPLRFTPDVYRRVMEQSNRVNQNPPPPPPQNQA